MAGPNFTSILDESPTEVVTPPPAPPGTYVCVVGQARIDKTTKKGTDFIEFPLRPVAAEADVDEEILEQIGGIDSIPPFRITFYLTEDAAYRLDRFHEHCGIDLADGKSRRQRSDDVMNAEVRAVIINKPEENGDRVFVEVRRTLPVE